MHNWKVELEDKTIYFYSGDTPGKACKLYEAIFGVKPISVTPDGGNALKVAKIERERFSLPRLKVIIAGSRTFDRLSDVKKAIEEANFKIGEVVSGTAQGVDTMGEYWAEKNNIPIKQFPADWEKYGKRAGHLRNAEMGEYADALILVWDGQSVGSASMLKIVQEKRMPIYQLIVTP